MKKLILSKTWAWTILIVLVLLDASLDVIFAQGKGLESNILKPAADLFVISNPLVLILIYFVVKVLAFLIEKVDKVPKAKELVLTALVLVYGVFDLWLASVYFFNFSLFRNQFYLIPILIIIGIAYSWWAENKLKTQK